MAMVLESRKKGRTVPAARPPMIPPMKPEPCSLAIMPAMKPGAMQLTVMFRAATSRARRPALSLLMVAIRVASSPATMRAAAARLWEKGYRNAIGIYTPASKFPLGFLELIVLNDDGAPFEVCYRDAEGGDHVQQASKSGRPARASRCPGSAAHRLAEGK